jgi:anaerobic ribonucleoside-triphosphate reductase
MEKCKCCGKEMVPWCGVEGCTDHVEVYSRPCGYLRPIVTWNDGKRQEFEDRVNYTFPAVKNEQD